MYRVSEIFLVGFVRLPLLYVSAVRSPFLRSIALVESVLTRTS